MWLFRIRLRRLCRLIRDENLRKCSYVPFRVLQVIYKGLESATNLLQDDKISAMSKFKAFEDDNFIVLVWFNFFSLA